MYFCFNLAIETEKNLLIDAGISDSRVSRVKTELIWDIPRMILLTTLVEQAWLDLKETVFFMLLTLGSKDSQQSIMQCTLVGWLVNQLVGWLVGRLFSQSISQCAKE